MKSLCKEEEKMEEKKLNDASWKKDLARAAIDLASSCSVITLEENTPGLWIETFINFELGSFVSELNKQVVMEKLLGSKMIRPISHIIIFLLLKQRLNMPSSKGWKLSLTLWKGCNPRKN